MLRTEHAPLRLQHLDLQLLGRGKLALPHVNGREVGGDGERVQVLLAVHPPACLKPPALRSSAASATLPWS